MTADNNQSKFDACLAAKCLYPTLNRIVTESILRKCIEKEKTSLLRDWLLDNSAYLVAVEDLLNAILKYSKIQRPVR